MAAGESLTFTLSGTQAGSNQTITSALKFAGGGDSPKTLVQSLAPGIGANLNANPSCLSGAPQVTGTSCQVGTAAVSFSVGGAPQPDATGNVYLVPPAAGSNDFAGFQTVVPSVGISQYTGASLRTTPTVGVDLTTNFSAPPAGVSITGVSLTLNSTLNGVPFTFLPTSCGMATSTAAITYFGATPAATVSGSFQPSGCSNLPYNPKLSAAITKDKNDNGAALTLIQTQALGESSSKQIVFTLPKGLTPNVVAAAPCLTGSGTGCQIGTAKATSAGVPAAALANGIVRLSGTALAPVISVSFPAPFGLTDTGQVNLAAGTVTFADVPDLPLLSLELDVTGPNGQKAFNTDCKPANITGVFTPQNGAAPVTAVAPIQFTGCAAKPTASGSTSGLAGGHPKLTFKTADSAKVASVAIGLPGGLKFNRSAITSKKTCTTPKGAKKKKCTTTTLIKGLSIKGGKAKSVALKRGKLVITLKKAASRVTITVGGPLVSESKGLQTKVKKHKVKTLKFTLKVTDAKKVATTLSLKARAH
jgi:hypothetical protein